MIFAEEKIEKGYKYSTNDASGLIEIFSDKKLDAQKLDCVFVAIFQVASKNNSKIVEGDVKGESITYKITKASPWSDIKEDDDVLKNNGFGFILNNKKDNKLISIIKKIWKMLKR